MKKRTTLDLGLSDGKESLKLKTTSIGPVEVECDACHGHGSTEDDECGFFAVECKECDGKGWLHKKEEEYTIGCTYPSKYIKEKE